MISKKWGLCITASIQTNLWDAFPVPSLYTHGDISMNVSSWNNTAAAAEVDSEKGYMYA